jgi:surface antigen
VSATLANTLAVARSQLGIKEPGLGDDSPGDQVTKYGHWYAAWSGQRGYIDTYWCAMWCSWVLATAGHSIESNGRFGNCNPWIKWFKARQRWAGRNSPRVGALVFYDWNNDGWCEHVGIVEAILPDGRIQAIEGNASIGGGAPDGVYRMRRARSYIAGYGLINYDSGGGAGTAGPASKRLPGPVAIGADPQGKLGTRDARAVPWSLCPQMGRGFGGAENASQRLWVAYFYRLMGTYSPGYFAQIAADPVGRKEIAGLEIGSVTIRVAEVMTRQVLGKKAPAFRGVVIQEAWKPYQPASW